MLRARWEGVVQRSKEAECTFHGGVVPANAQRAPLLPEKPLQTMPNRVHTLQSLMYSIFPFSWKGREQRWFQALPGL